MDIVGDFDKTADTATGQCWDQKVFYFSPRLEGGGRNRLGWVY
jgi:hypothetical protein